MWSEHDADGSVEVGRSSPLHRSLARRMWRAHPTVRLYYHPGDDTLVAEILEAPARDEISVHAALLVEFDGVDAAALPTALYLTGVTRNPNSAAAASAARVLGPRVWGVAHELVARAGSTTEVQLTPEEVAERCAEWDGIVDRLPSGGAVIGVEVLADAVQAAAVDDNGRTVDMRRSSLPGLDPDSVVTTIARLLDDLSAGQARYIIRDCRVGVSIGGPVNSATGLVQYYGKPVDYGGAEWFDVPLAVKLRAATGRDVVVVNDAEAYAHYERVHGIGASVELYAVLVVGRGVGAALVEGGVVRNYLMEIGVFVPGGPEKSLKRRESSIEDRAGVPAIVEQAAAAVNRPIRTIEDAAALAEGDGADAARIREVFYTAGGNIARGIAAAGVFVNPRAWAVYGPCALTDDMTAAGAAFREGLGMSDRFTTYAALWKPDIQMRPGAADLGCRAAASAGRSRATDHRTRSAARRPVRE